MPHNSRIVRFSRSRHNEFAIEAEEVESRPSDSGLVVEFTIEGAEISVMSLQMGIKSPA